MMQVVNNIPEDSLKIKHPRPKSMGKFIVIDGTDGSGKTTQTELLKRKLEYFRHKVKIVDFPQYNTKSAGLIEDYLEGKYGSPESVGPYRASIFYACDRFAARFEIRHWLENGYIVIANRYTTSSLAHQGCKIDNPLERKAFYSWLLELEYELFKIPCPDNIIILHLPASLAQELSQKRFREEWYGKIKDIHEADLEHLQKAEQVYLEIAHSYPGFKVIACAQNNKILPRQAIHNKIWQTVARIVTD